MRFSPQSILRENLGAEMDAETHSDAPGCFLHGRRPFPTPSAQVGEGIGPGRASAHRTSLWRPPCEVGRPQQGGPAPVPCSLARGFLCHRTSSQAPGPPEHTARATLLPGLYQGNLLSHSGHGSCVSQVGT